MSCRAGAPLLISSRRYSNLLRRSVEQHRRAWSLYSKAVEALGVLAPLWASFTLVYIAYTFTTPGYLTPPKLPFKPSESLALLAGILISLLLHETSHFISLTLKGVKNCEIGVSIGTIIGGYVAGWLPKEKYREVAKPFFSSGIGSNLLLLIATYLAYLATGISELLVLTIVNGWFLLLNSLPIPPLDGGMLYDLLSEHVKIVKLVRLLLIIFIVAAFITNILLKL